MGKTRLKMYYKNISDNSFNNELTIDEIFDALENTKPNSDEFLEKVLHIREKLFDEIVINIGSYEKYNQSSRDDLMKDYCRLQELMPDIYIPLNIRANHSEEIH